MNDPIDDPMDAVFRALADPGRRVLLDALRDADGQTLGALCEMLPPLDLARAAYLVGTASVVVGRSEQALVLADRYEQLLIDATDAAEVDHADAHELRARARAAVGRTDEARDEQRCSDEFDIAHADDRTIVGDLALGPWHGLRGFGIRGFGI